MARRVVAFNLFTFLGGVLLAQAQSQPQQIPNMGQQITPLAPQGSEFRGLNPGLPSPAQNWLASQAVTLW